MFFIKWWCALRNAQKQTQLYSKLVKTLVEHDAPKAHVKDWHYVNSEYLIVYATSGADWEMEEIFYVIDITFERIVTRLKLSPSIISWEIVESDNVLMFYFYYSLPWRRWTSEIDCMEFQFDLEKQSWRCDQTKS